MKCDFSGYATKCNVRCTDGRIIKPDAFRNDDGRKVPLVYNHNHDDLNNVLGHAILENRDDGVFAYCFLNNSNSANLAREAIRHGDIECLSIWANKLTQRGPDVVHGVIREVSMVLAGANPGAILEGASVMAHAVLDDDDACIFYTGDHPKIDDPGEEITHSDGGVSSKMDENKPAEPSKESKEETIGDVFNTLTDKQKDVVYAMIGLAVEDAVKGDESTMEQSTIKEGDDDTMAHNLFDQNNPAEKEEDVLSHSEMTAIINDAKRYGSMKESVIQHGITQIDYLIPDPKLLNNPPDWVKRDTTWVPVVMNSVHRTPFSRIKSVFADLTEDDARAKGYIKGKMKKEEVFSLLKRTTTPTTIYKKQKIDRDDVVDITDFDVIAWLKSEMRFMLDEEIARAILIGDGRLASSDDKINESNIRPISTDESLYTIQKTITVGEEDVTAKNFIRAAIKARIEYKGSGQPTLFTTEEMLTNMLLLTDTTGRDLYPDEAALARKLRVNKIVTVEVMEGAKGKNGEALYGIIVNLTDYNIGADKGGAINMFDDFDIDYNAQKYLIETRCSGALVRPYSAIAISAAPASQTP